MKIAKRLFVLALVCLIIFSLLPPVTAQAATTGFTDINDHPYYKEIMFLYNNGIVNGKSDTTFAPKDNLLREEMVTILWRVAGEPSVKTTTNFTDNRNSSKYYYKALLWAKHTGVSNGYTDGSFGVGKSMTHQEVIQFLANFAVNIVGCTTESELTSQATPSGFSSYSWGKGPLNWAIKEKLIDANKNAEFKNANNPCRRGSAALIFYNFYKAFQNKYAMVYVERCLSSPGRVANLGGNDFVDMLTKTCGVPAKNIKQYGKYYPETKQHTKDIDTVKELESAFYSAFSKATCIDICYVYICAHSDPDSNGLVLITESPEGYKTDIKEFVHPSKLYNLTASYKGKMVVVLETCFSQKFVDYYAKKNSKVDILGPTADAENAYIGSITSADVNARIGRGLATHCWTKALQVDKGTDKPYADGGKKLSVSYYRNKTQKLQFNGNNDGFVSFSELSSATKSAISTMHYDLCLGSSQNLLFHSSAPNYCAFGKMS